MKHLSVFLAAVAAASLCQAKAHDVPHSGLSQVRVAQTTTPEAKPQASHATHAQPAAAKPWHDLSGLPPPRLTDDLGSHQYKITTANPEAQRFFNQGLILAYGFNHLEALRAFRHAQSLDPNCAMCFWGEAYVLGPNLNLPMDEQAVEKAEAAAAKAVENAANATPQEQALAAAILTRYRGPGERAELDQKYAVAMSEVAKQFPGDPDIATLAAESLMLLSPWDYWLEQGRTPKSHTSQAQQLLEAALNKSPDHIGAIHFYIHLVEASDRPERAEAHAETLRTAVPGAGHLVHMPSHIFLRVGRYRDAFEDNRNAAAADERYFAANAEVQGPYRLVYYPHNVHFYMTAALMAGQARDAVEAANKLSQLIPAEAGEAVPPVQPIMQAPYFVHAQFSTPQDILALPEPSEKLPFVKAAWHYARGVAHALLGDSKASLQEAEAIEKIAQADHSGLEQAAVPAKGVLVIAANNLRAKSHAVAGKYQDAQRHAEAAIAAEKDLPYMEPPYWYMPTHQTLGAILLAKNDPQAASAAFGEVLKKAPNSVWALRGLEQAQAKLGDAQAAAETQKRLKAALPSGEQPPELDRY